MHRYLAEFDFRYNERANLVVYDATRSRLPAAGRSKTTAPRRMLVLWSHRSRNLRGQADPHLIVHRNPRLNSNLHADSESIRYRFVQIARGGATRHAQEHM